MFECPTLGFILELWYWMEFMVNVVNDVHRILASKRENNFSCVLVQMWLWNQVKLFEDFKTNCRIPSSNASRPATEATTVVWGNSFSSCHLLLISSCWPSSFGSTSRKMVVWWCTNFSLKCWKLIPEDWPAASLNGEDVECFRNLHPLCRSPDFSLYVWFHLVLLFAFVSFVLYRIYVENYFWKVIKSEILYL